MAELRRRLAAAERELQRRLPDIVTIVIINALDRMGRNVARSGGHRFDRAHGESIADFRKRAAAEAQALGLRSIIFSDDEDEDVSRAS